MKLAAMVTLYNPNKDNINNIKEYINEVDIIYLIDNSDNDNSFLLFKSDKINYMPNYKNLGIAAALNIACNKAIENGYSWILTMDQDSKLSKSSLSKLKTFVENNNMKDVGIVSPYHNVETNRIKSADKIEECLDVMTSGNLLNLNIYAKVGGFKEWLFIDDVDIEYCLNLNKNHYKVLRLNDVLLDHTLGATKAYKLFGKKIICSNHVPFRRYYMVRNMLYVYDMYHHIFPEFCEHIKRVQKGQIKNILVFEKNKIKKLYMMFKGYKDYKNSIKGEMP